MVVGVLFMKNKYTTIKGHFEILFTPVKAGFHKQSFLREATFYICLRALNCNHLEQIDQVQKNKLRTKNIVSGIVLSSA